MCRVRTAESSEPARQATLQLGAGDYAAVVTTVGGALVELTHRGRPLVRELPLHPPRPRFRGAVLAPWPNRIRDGRYRYAGHLHQLPLNEPERGCALHGLLLWHEWHVLHADTHRVVLSATLWPQQGYPFRVAVTVEYTLDPVTGLRTAVGARNDGDVTAPFGTAAHPYVVAGDGGVDDWVLQLPARSVLRADPQRLLPFGQDSAAGSVFDFREGRPLAGIVLDHTFGDIDLEAGPAGGVAHALLTSARDGNGVRMSWDAASPWVQVHTTEDPAHEWHRSALALEPMTCPPDAFNSGVDVWELEPGESRRVAWSLAAHEPSG